MIQASLKKDYKRQTDNDGKRAERKQQEYNDIDWKDLYHRNQLSSLKPGSHLRHNDITERSHKQKNT